MTDITIRKFKKADIPQTSIVMQKSFGSIDQDYSLEELEEYFEDKLKGSHNYVAIKEDIIIGFIMSDKAGESIVIYVIGVLPEYEGERIGSQLMDHIKSIAKSMNLKDIKLVAQPKSKAHSWYKRLGFVENGWVEMELVFDK